jgi:DNA-binding NtrC family response regulator
MNPKQIIMGKRVLIVDDEEDILAVLVDLLELCKIDTASSFEEAKKMLETNLYHCVILDIMGVRGYDLLKIANEREMPALMLTAHALSEESLKRSIENGAAYYVPKNEMNSIATFVADVIDAIDKEKNPLVRWFERLSGIFDVLFTGPDWREKEKEFWDQRLGME